MNNGTLAVLPSLTVRTTPGGGVALTRKFIDGMIRYRELWDDPVTAFIEPSQERTSNLDEIEVDPAKLPFRVEVISFLDPDLGRRLAGHRMVLGSVYHRQNRLSAVCRSIGVPCVTVAEFSLKTRFQVLRAEVRNPAISLRRHWWEFNQERQNRRAIAMASGVQCNGTPTFEAYRAINPSPMLFFDTRTREEMLISEAELAGRLDAMGRGGPLRLLFSGRLIAMKGADHLVPVAAGLEELGVPFAMTICGGGALEPRIRAEIDRLGLGDRVKLAGVLDFITELTPMTRRQADLFVCCHRTGDPSCTYLEVMSCGVPIVGYDNEAFRGVVRESGVGWAVPMDQPGAVARKIAGLNADRPALADASRRSLEFARRHTFEGTTRARIAHLKACSAAAGARPAAV